MRPLVIFVILILSGLALFTEFKSIKESALFSNWFDLVPLLGVGIFSIYFFIRSIIQFFVNKKINSFLPLLLCVSVLLIVLWHKRKIENLDNSQTKFTASTFDIGSDGGFILDFKVNGHLKAEKRDHWDVTYYWGSYEQIKDTIKLNLPLDFALSKQALLIKDSLLFLNDTTRFIVLRQ